MLRHCSQPFQSGSRLPITHILRKRSIAASALCPAFIWPHFGDAGRFPSAGGRNLTPNLDPWRQDSAGSRHVRRKNRFAPSPSSPRRRGPIHPSLIFWADKGIPAWARIGRSIGHAKFCPGPRPQINCLRSHFILHLVCSFA